MKNIKGLGRGLSALLSETITEDQDRQSLNVNIDDLETNIYQPRKVFDEKALNELAESIRKNGLLQPIIVHKAHGSDKYSIIAGERRWRASRIAGLTEVSVIIKDIEDKKNLLEYAIMENIQRENLTPIEEAEAYLKLIEEFGYSQEQIAKSLDKSRSHVANILRLNSLPTNIKEQVNQGIISMGHARALIGADDVDELIKKIIDDNLNVRETEKLVQSSKSELAVKPKKPKAKDEDLAAIENSITELLGLKIKIDDSPSGGKVSIYFQNLEELDRILKRLSS